MIKRDRKNPRPHYHSKLRRRLGRVGVYLAALAIVIILVSPILHLLLSSFSPRTELSSIPPHWVPQNPTLDHYKALLFTKYTQILGGESPKFPIALRNNIIVCLGASILALLLGLPAAYGISRFRFKGKNMLLIGIVSVRMVPFGSMIIPFYLIMSRLGLLDSKLGLILVYQSFILPFVIWIMSSYFSSIPVESEESAKIDGANSFAIFTRIALPIALPGLATTALMSFMATWDELFYALILTSSWNAKTMSVAITELSTRWTIDFSLWITAGCIGMVVPFIIALLCQKYVISGLTIGAVKG